MEKESTQIVRNVYVSPLLVLTLISIFSTDEIMHLMHALSEKMDPESKFLFVGGMMEDSFPNMSTVKREELKNKLMENDILTIVCGRVFINPEYIMYDSGTSGTIVNKKPHQLPLEG